jgi:hypothetical protein
MQFRIVRATEHLVVELTEQVQLEPLLSLIRKLGHATRSHGDKRILFDLLRLEGDMHAIGQIQIGQMVARSFPHMEKVASVVPAEKITRASEKIAREHGVNLRIFDNLKDAQTWFREADPPPSPPARPTSVLDPVRAAIWQAVRHLFPSHAKAIQLPNGSLAISWSVANQPDALHEMATPINIRLEPDLVERLRFANPEQRKRIATHQESAFRAGLVGYNPFTDVPRARVIVLG